MSDSESKTSPSTNSPIERYDLVVIGSGQCGNPLASAFHDAGRSVAVIERGAVGGTCVNFGCTPTKTLVASAEVANLARRAPEFGVHVRNVDVDMRAVVERKRSIVAASRKSSEKKFQNGIDLLRGSAFFTAPKHIRVQLNEGGYQNLTADVIVIDTGLSPALPDLPGIEDIAFLNNVSIMELEQLPEHLIVLGGGYVGLEFAQMFRRFGSKITLVQKGRQLLADEDPDIAQEIAQILEEDGVEILLAASATQVVSTNNGVRLTVSVNGISNTINGTHLLVATGRKPNTDTLNLAVADIAVDKRGFIQVNDKLETSAPGVFAVGDVNGGPAFTHISYDDFRILKSNLLEGGHRVTTGRPLPYCVFIDPQLARIGISEKTAQQAGRKYKIARIKMSSVARAFETGQTRGFMKALVDPDTEEILGAAILGADGGEIMAVLEVAMMGNLSYRVLKDAIYAHPTFAESLNILFANLDV